MWRRATFVTLAMLAGRDADAALPFAKLAGMQTAFLAIPAAQRDKLVLRQRVLHENPADAAPIHLWVEADGARVPLPVAPDGSFDVPDRPDWVAQHLTVQNDQPAGSLHLQTDLAIVPPAASTVSAAYLQAAVVQAQQAIKAAARQMGGLFGGLVAPGVSGVSIRLARCCTESLSIAGTVVRQATSATLIVPRSLLDANPTATILTTAPIAAIEPETD